MGILFKVNISVSVLLESFEISYNCILTSVVISDSDSMQIERSRQRSCQHQRPAAGPPSESDAVSRSSLTASGQSASTGASSHHAPTPPSLWRAQQKRCCRIVILWVRENPENRKNRSKQTGVCALEMSMNRYKQRAQTPVCCLPYNTYAKGRRQTAIFPKFSVTRSAL